MAAAANTYSNSLVLLLGILTIAAHRSFECLGFAPAHNSRCRGRGCSPWPRVEKRRSRSSSWRDDIDVDVDVRSRSKPSSLHGLANVNDYFATFNSDESTSADDSNVEEQNQNKKGKDYLGHGRISSNDKGGLFDTNDYFNSFGSDDDDDDDNIDEDASPLNQQEQELSINRRMIRMTYEEIVAYNNARLCPKLLLTQRAIQSFIYLLEACRDPHSGKWIEDFLELQNLGNYHGTGAFNVTKHPTWDAVLYDIMRQPNDKMIVSAKRRGRGHGGWSKNNPYLQERWVEFKIDIRPASLVQRLLPVREQLAEEFLRDLEIVGIVDGMIMDSYFSNLRGGSELLQLQSSSSLDTALFDRISVDILTNFTEFQEGSSSPFRRGNFDLLYSLCTQASAHRLLRELQSTSSEDDITFRWFKKFYTEQVPEYFDGDQSFGRADDFIDALLRTPPSLVEMHDGKRIGLTDPLKVAERIIAMRSEIAQEWKSAMREVKADHAGLADVLFRVMMGRTIDESGNEVIEIQEETTEEDLSDSTGAFE